MEKENKKGYNNVMESMEQSIIRLKEEVKESHKHITNLLKEREALKRAYSMQIDLVQALEAKIDKLIRGGNK